MPPADLRASMRLFPALVLLALLTPPAMAYEHCFTADRALCAQYDWKTDDAYVDAQASNGVTAGAGRHGSGPFLGTEAHAFVPGGTYLFVYEGEWMGQERTLIGVGAANIQIVWLQMDERATSYPSAYHCTYVLSVVHKCGPGLP